MMLMSVDIRLPVVVVRVVLVDRMDSTEVTIKTFVMVREVVASHSVVVQSCPVLHSALLLIFLLTPPIATTGDRQKTMAVANRHG